MAQKISKKIIVVLAVTALAILIQIAGLGKPHFSPLPPRIECSMILSQASLDDGSSLLVDTHGKRMLFTNQDGQLIRVIEFDTSKDPISWALEVSSSPQDRTYQVHGVKSIYGGNYLSSESVLVYDAHGNLIGESFHEDFPDNEYVSSVDYLYEDPQPDRLFNTLDESFYIDYSPIFLIECIVFCLSLIWLLVAAIALLVWVVKNKKYQNAKVVLVALFCVCVTACFYTVNNSQQIKAGFEENVEVVSTQITDMLTTSESIRMLDEMSDSGLDVYLKDPSNQETVANLGQSLDRFSMAYGKEQSLYILVTSVSKDNVPYILAYTGVPNAVGKKYESAADQRQLLLESSGDSVQVSTTVTEATISARPIANEAGEIIAVVSVGSNIDNVLANQMSKSFGLVINLLALLIGLYAAFSAINMCRKAIIATIRQKSSDASDRIVNMSGMYMMIYKFAYNADKVFVVYIAASLCQGMDLATQAIYVAIPVSLCYAGQWIGTFFATPLLRAFGERRVALVMCVLSAFIMIFTGWSIIVGSIVLYSIGRGLMGVAISGILYVISDTLPLYAKTKDQKRSAIGSSLQGSTVATILITLIGGYVSQYAGYSLIYAIGAFMCILLFVMTIFTLDKKKHDVARDGKKDEEKSSYRQLWSIFLKPEFVMYIIFFTVPNLLATGYSSYIFPLIASGAGVSEVLLANISVFTVAAMHISYGPIKKFSQRYNSSVMLVVPSLAMCVGYLCFLVSPTIYWAIAMMFVVAVFNYMTNPNQKTYQMEVSEKYGREPALVQSNYYNIYSAIQTVRSPILSAFMTLGVYIGCVVLGGVCAVMFGVFGLYTKLAFRRSAKTSEDDSSNSTEAHPD